MDPPVPERSEEPFPPAQTEPEQHGQKVPLKSSVHPVAQHAPPDQALLQMPFKGPRDRRVLEALLEPPQRVLRLPVAEEQKETELLVELPEQLQPLLE